MNATRCEATSPSRTRAVGRALLGVAGLVARRQAALFNRWQCWLAVAFGVALAFGLTDVSLRTADRSAIYLWLYANNWTWLYVTNFGNRLELLQNSAAVIGQYLTLSCWSFLGGFMLGSISRCSIGITGAAFSITLAIAGFARTPHVHRPWHTAVFSLTFYNVIFPISVLLALAYIPSIWGMRRGVRCGMWAPILLLALTGSAAAAEAPKMRAIVKPPDQREPAPEFALKDSRGRTATLNKYRGKVVLLDFWATWCHGCKEEIPWFAEFQRRYGSKGLRVVGVSLDEDGWKIVKPFLKTARVPYRIVLGDDTTAKSYGIQNMPDTFLIDRQGRIAAAYAGLVDKDDVEKNIRTMLDRRARLAPASSN